MVALRPQLEIEVIVYSPVFCLRSTVRAYRTQKASGKGIGLVQWHNRVGAPGWTVH